MSVQTTKPALIEQGHWLTVRDCKRVLVVVHTVTFAQRLREVFELLETDLRIQLVFTVAPHAFGNGVTEFLQNLGITTVPWSGARTWCMGRSSCAPTRCSARQGTTSTPPLAFTHPADSRAMCICG